MKKRYIAVSLIIVGTFLGYKTVTYKIESDYIESLRSYYSFTKENIHTIEEKMFSGEYDENRIIEILNRLETYQYIESEIKNEELKRDFKDIVLEQRSEFENATLSVYKEFYEASKHLKKDKELLEKVVKNESLNFNDSED